jgi:hypothetical protein
MRLTLISSRRFCSAWVWASRRRFPLSSRWKRPPSHEAGVESSSDIMWEGEELAEGLLIGDVASESSPPAVGTNNGGRKEGTHFPEAS